MRKLFLTLLVLALVGGAVAYGAWYYWTHRYDEMIVAVAGRYRLEPALVKAIIYEESFFHARARSAQNAVGLMQITPIAAQQWIESTRARSFTEALERLPVDGIKERRPTLDEALNDPEVSLHVGCWYLQYLFGRYEGEPDPLPTVLAAYNAGPANVERWAPAETRARLSRQEFIERIEFPVTRHYVRQILARYDRYQRDGGL